MMAPSRKTKLPAKQLGGVENPATVLLIPTMLTEGAKWWSYDGVLLGGVEVVPHQSPRIMYLPRPIPRSWGEHEFHIVVEYEGEESSRFTLKLYYGCGDPSELRLGESEILKGETGKVRRIKFRLNPELISSNQLFRCTLEIQRTNGGKGTVLVYGAWMEIGVD